MSTFKLNSMSFSVRDQYCTDIMNEHYDQTNGDDIFHIVNESPISFYLTYIVPKSSPFISTLNSALREAREMGFNSLATLKMNAHLELKRMKRYQKGFLSKKETQVITLAHFRNVFGFYAFCVFVCCVSFVIELLVGFISSQRIN